MRLQKQSVLVLFGGAALTLGLASARGPSAPTAVGASGPHPIPKIQQRLINSESDRAQTALTAASTAPRASGFSPASGATTAGASAYADYYPSGPSGCAETLGSNVKVDQGCLNVSQLSYQGRAQAHNETAIAVNPRNANQLLAASNDYKLGDGLDGGTSFSTDGGSTWQNSEVPLEFTNGADFSSSAPNNQCASTPEDVARMYWQGGGDPSVAWDTRGNVYFAGLHFHRGTPVSENPDNSSGVYVHRSTSNGGASWSFPGTPVVTCSSPSSSTGLPLEDKPYIAIDDGLSSPYRDRIYVTWTFFNTDGTGYIFEAYSDNYGSSFSKPVAVTKRSDSPTICPNTYGLPTAHGNCNENQFSDPFVGPNGNLYVVFDNYNNALTSSNDNHNQVLLAESTNGGASFHPVVQVANFNDLPDCATYQSGQDFFRSCIPEKGSQRDSVFRATNYPSGQVNPGNAHQVVVTFGSYINADSNPSNGCVPQGINPVTGLDLYRGVKGRGACANKILLSFSNNGGTSFSGTGASPTQDPIVSNGAGQVHTDQWWQWSQFAANGRLVVSYYDRQYGNDEFTGSMDVTVSQLTTLSSFSQTRATTSSLPLPTEFPESTGNSDFMGDYTGLTVGGGVAHPLWTDTRNPDLVECGAPGPPAVCTFSSANGFRANNEDIATTRVST